jgi:hypothetical protein
MREHHKDIVASGGRIVGEKVGEDHEGDKSENVGHVVVETDDPHAFKAKFEKTPAAGMSIGVKMPSAAPPAPPKADPDAPFELPTRDATPAPVAQAAETSAPATTEERPRGPRAASRTKEPPPPAEHGAGSNDREPAVTHAMTHGNVVRRETISAGGIDPMTGHPIGDTVSRSEKVTIAGPGGKAITAVWKPTNGIPTMPDENGDPGLFRDAIDTRTFAVRERAVANAAQHFGIRAEPTVVRSIDGEEGSLMRWAEGTRHLETDEMLPRHQAESLRVMDYTLGNLDRNTHNVLIHEAAADRHGRLVGGPDRRQLVHIDGGASLPPAELPLPIQPTPHLKDQFGSLTPETHAMIKSVDPQALAAGLAKDGIDRTAARGALLRLNQLQHGETRHLELWSPSPSTFSTAAHLMQGSREAMRIVDQAGMDEAKRTNRIRPTPDHEAAHIDSTLEKVYGGR